MSRIMILGVPIDSLSSFEAVERIFMFLQSASAHHVITPNSEMLVEAFYNAKFKDVLQNSDLNLPDSVGIVLGAWMTGQTCNGRVTGVDTVIRLLDELHSDTSVFFLGGREGAGQRASEICKTRNPRLNVVGVYEGSPSKEESVEILRRINSVNPALLLVAYGAPLQDIWIAEHVKNMRNIRVAMGVGGTFDFIAKIRSRAPKIIQNIGLEWFWRFAHEPWRLRRIINAVVIYPFLILRHGKCASRSLLSD